MDGVSSCKEPIEPLTLNEIADRCHSPDQVWAFFSQNFIVFLGGSVCFERAAIS